MWSPQAEGRSLTENMPFCRFKPAYNAKTTQRLLVEFQFLADWPPYSPNLNPLDFDTRHDLQAKAPVTPH
jgi:hypothetical protein